MYLLDIKSSPLPTGQDNNRKISSIGLHFLTKTTWKLKTPGGILVFLVLVQVCLRVPAPPHSGLAKAVEAAPGRTAAPTGLQAKVVEEPGQFVKSVLVRSNQFPRKSCGRNICPWMARGEDRLERCYVEGVTYLARCRICRDRQLQQGVKESDVLDECYIVKSRRSVFTRSEAHFNIYKPGKGGVVNQLEEEGDCDEEKVGLFTR